MSTPASTPVKVGRVNFARVVKSEIIKLFTLRSTWWTLVITAVITIGLGVLTAYTRRMLATSPDLVGTDKIPPMAMRASDAVTSPSAIYLAQLIICVLAVLAITNDYSSGQIRSTLSAVPTRTPVLVAKALIIGVVAFVVTFVAWAVAMFAAWPVLAGFANGRLALPPGWSVTDDRFTTTTWQTIAGMALASLLMAVFALAVGALLRNTAAGIAVVFIVVMLLPGLIGALPWKPAETVSTYMLTSCLQGLYATAGAAFGFVKSLWTSILWALVPAVAAGILLKKRDA